jgi:tRNA threonylcarbamoyladenosine biosynthesis protein TsaE
VRSFRTYSDEETINLGKTLAAQLPRHGVVLLIGNLGAGKTTLAKGIVSGFSAAETDEVSSPTFTLIHEYGSPSKGNLVYHIDLYRLDQAEEIATLGLDEIFDREALVLIEWGERFLELMPPNRIEIYLERTTGDDHARNIDVRECGEARLIDRPTGFDPDQGRGQ